MIAFLLYPVFANAQEPDEQGVDKKRLTTVIVVSAVGYGVTLYSLSRAWYTQSPKSSFHFFNDNAEWKQVDKVGHFFSAFYFSYGADRALQWTYLNPKKSARIGTVTGGLMLAPVEIMDGFSSAYGASVGDLVADFAGAGFYYAQTALWQAPRIYPKFSFHRTSYAKKRPAVLGDGLAEEFLKDYNGQTYWLSVDMDKFVPGFPKWLNLTAGYGAEGMVFAREEDNNAAGYRAYRQYYFGLDFDLKAIPTHSRFIRTLLDAASMIHLPAPVMEITGSTFKFKPFYF